jgi:ABC-type lipoprotein release transport system permease subunit
VAFRKLLRLIAQSIRRNKRDLTLSGVGIVVGISTLLLFTALGAGIQSVVLEEIFVVRQLEVVPKSVDVGGGLFGGGESEGLDDATVDEIRQLDGVESAFPKMKLTFPSSIRGGKSLLGQDLVAEMVADGIPPRLVDDADLRGDLAFRDWEAGASCSNADECPGGFACRDGTCRGQSCTGGDGETCGGPSYCDRGSGQCRMPIPVIASPRLLEIYNSNLQTALGGAQGAISQLPNLSAEDLAGFEFAGIFGQSYLGRSAEGDPTERKMRLVGFSERAIQMGVTMPIGYVERLNAEFGSEGDDETYHSIVVETTSNDAVARVARTIKEDLDLALSDRYDQAQRAGLLIMVLTIVFNLISLIILAISAINIMHTFLMILLERRQEIGLMRSLGATRTDIRLLILGESSIVGLAGGLAGILVGLGGIELIDYLFRTQLGDFPFKPDSLFAVYPWMLAAAVGAALVFCWIGALLPAFRASSIDPAEALTGH